MTTRIREKRPYLLQGLGKKPQNMSALDVYEINSI